MPRCQKPKIMLARFIVTPETFEHLHLGIPAKQYHRLKQALLISALDVLMTKLDPGLLGEQGSDTNHSKPSNPRALIDLY
jgi:hypothetical protein